MGNQVDHLLVISERMKIEQPVLKPELTHEEVWAKIF